MAGLESFSNLKGLVLQDNTMATVDISAITTLKNFTCSTCDMNAFITGNLNLTKLTLYAPNLTGINLNSMTFLKQLSLSGLPLVTIDLSANSLLLYCSINSSNIATLALTGNLVLEELYLDNNDLVTLNISTCTALKRLTLTHNALTALDISALTGLQALDCRYNSLTEIDISNNTLITSLGFNYNPIERLFLKNGTYYQNIFSPLSNTLGNLEYVCADESSIIQYKGILDALPGNLNYEINSYCSFVPSGFNFIIKGNTKFDSANNGCDNADNTISNFKLNITNGINTGSLIANQSGQYTLPVKAGTHTLTPVIENPTYFNVSPTSVTVTFPATTSPSIQNFCISPNGIHKDLEVALSPISAAIPGFDATYMVIYKNSGNQIENGVVTVSFNDAVLDFVSATPALFTQVNNLLSWTFQDLLPLETRVIYFKLNLNSPMESPAVNSGDILNFTGGIVLTTADENSSNNFSGLQQTVVNSFDPNDKTCLEGTSITPDMIGKYVHYVIRFENTGTFPAQNIVVKDMIDATKFDVSSLISLNASHNYITRITGNKVEFIFENINLPFEDATNDGYIVFKIKTLPTLVLGNSFSNSASIYFDYNFPIVTNPAVTTVAVLGTEDFVFNNYLTVYPNPTNDVLKITSKQEIELKSMEIYNMMGQLVISVPNASGVSSIDVSNLSTGNYFLKVVSDKGTSNSKFIKQ